MEVYLLGAIRAVRLVMPVMQAQKAGIIVNISAARTFEPTGMFATSAVFR
jgi:NADP-dependent 3-hydroxy acid dehydrogenase YdfG